MSIRLTVDPLARNAWAIPVPIMPAPMTAISAWISLLATIQDPRLVLRLAVTTFYWQKQLQLRFSCPLQSIGRRACVLGVVHHPGTYRILSSPHALRVGGQRRTG